MGAPAGEGAGNWGQLPAGTALPPVLGDQGALVGVKGELGLGGGCFSTSRSLVLLSLKETKKLGPTGPVGGGGGRYLSPSCSQDPQPLAPCESPL